MLLHLWRQQFLKEVFNHGHTTIAIGAKRMVFFFSRLKKKYSKFLQNSDWRFIFKTYKFFSLEWEVLFHVQDVLYINVERDELEILINLRNLYFLHKILGSGNEMKLTNYVKKVGWQRIKVIHFLLHKSHHTGL